MHVDDAGARRAYRPPLSGVKARVASGKRIRGHQGPIGLVHRLQPQRCPRLVTQRPRFAAGRQPHGTQREGGAIRAAPQPDGPRRRSDGSSSRLASSTSRIGSRSPVRVRTTIEDGARVSARACSNWATGGASPSRCSRTGPSAAGPHVRPAGARGSRCSPAGAARACAARDRTTRGRCRSRH